MDRDALNRLLTEGALELRGDGQAGSGLTLILQVVAAVILADPTLYLQQWPLFTAARKGAPTSGFLRISRRPILKASPITHPHIAVLMDEFISRACGVEGGTQPALPVGGATRAHGINEGICAMVDCLQGVPRDGIVVCDSPDPPAAVAQRLRLTGTIYTIDGHGLAARHLSSGIGNISMLACLMEIIPGCSIEVGRQQLASLLKKRRLPASLVEMNLRVYDDSRGAARVTQADFAPTFRTSAAFSGYGVLNPGAQSDLRLSRRNRTSAYAPPGVRLRFANPNADCNGCGLCIVNCPENIVEFIPDERRGIRVTGADVTNYCKLCRECIAICPKHLFTEVVV